MNRMLNIIAVVFAVPMLFATTQSCAFNSGNKSNSRNIADKTEKTMIKELSKKDFISTIADYENVKEWKYKGTKPAIVDFFATWCGPCKALSPTLEALAEEYKGVVDFYKVDVDKADDLASDFGIQSVPTLIFIPVEGEPKIVQGALPKNNLKEIIEKELVK